MKRLTPIKAIRAKCLDCSCGSKDEVKKCWDKDCSLYPYRLGKNPYILPREISEEQRQALRVRGKALFLKHGQSSLKQTESEGV